MIFLCSDQPGDEPNRASKAGLHFGFPYCHQGNLIDPSFGSGKSCTSYEPPARVLGAHVAVLGMRFYTGKMFPEKYRNAVIVAEHGSWNRARKNGYRLMVAQLDGNRVTAYEPLVQGWLNAETDRSRAAPSTSRCSTTGRCSSATTIAAPSTASRTARRLDDGRHTPRKASPALAIGARRRCPIVAAWRSDTSEWAAVTTV